MYSSKVKEKRMCAILGRNQILIKGRTRKYGNAYENGIIYSVERKGQVRKFGRKSYYLSLSTNTFIFSLLIFYSDFS